MKEILLIGSGGHCVSCIDVIESENIYEIRGIILSSIKNSKPVLGYKILGTDKDLIKLKKQIPNMFIAIGQIKNFEPRKKIYEYLKKIKIDIPTIKSPSSYCSIHASLGRGTILMHNAIVNANSKVGENCIINNNSLVEHDVKIGNHCHISTGAIINGGVEIGEGTFVGSGSVIKEGTKIGNRVVIGAGKTILKDIPNGKIVSK